VPVKAYDIKKTSSTISGNMLMATEATENGKEMEFFIISRFFMIYLMP